MNSDTVSTIREKIDAAANIQIISHVRPDGDSISSIIALGMALIESGKEIQMISTDGVPSALRISSEWDRIKNKISELPDLIIALDSADRERLGTGLDSDSNVDINIDHHVTNTKYGDANLVEPDAVATCAILAKLIPELELSITPVVAEALLAGILADSQGFRTLNTSADALRVSADIIDMGADLPDIYFRTLVNRSFESARYWGAGLNNLQSENGIVWTRLSLEDRHKANYRGRDDADLINVLSAIQDTRIAVIFIEQDANNVKVSWRGSKGADVSTIAATFGGGGHVAAAGAMVEGSLDEVEERVINSTVELSEKMMVV